MVEKIRRVLKGDILQPEIMLDFPDWETIRKEEDQKIAAAFRHSCITGQPLPDWVQEIERRAETKQMRVNAWKRKTGGSRPTRSGELGAWNEVGIERMCHTYWGEELMAFSLAFVAGKIEFAEILPKDLTPTLLSLLSQSQREALFVMTVSSLYWGQETKPMIARDIVWTFGINPNRGFVPSDLRQSLHGALDIYHGVDRHHNPYPVFTGYKDLPAYNAVRREMGNAVLNVPEKLERWICRPISLCDDFGIKSEIPYYFARWYERPRDTYVHFK